VDFVEFLAVLSFSNSADVYVSYTKISRVAKFFSDGRLEE